MRKAKPKFDKKKCLQCIYHQETTNTGWPVIIKNRKGEEKVVHVNCNYAGVTRETCLQDAGAGRVVDMRGDGPDCNLFTKGAVVKTMTDNIYIGPANAENIYK